MRKTLIPLPGALALAGLIVAGLVAAVAGSAAAATTHTVTSPDGQIVVTVTESDDGALSYGVTAAGHDIFIDSPLGITTGDADFTTDLAFVVEQRRTLDDTYTLPAGTKPQYRDHANELTLSYEKDGYPIDLVVRAYDDGIAYRYVLDGTGPVSVTGESTGFRLPVGTGGWAADWRTDYEGDFTYRGATELDAGTFTMPLLASVEDNTYFALMSEAQVVSGNASYAPSNLAGSGDGDGLLQVARTPDQAFPMMSQYPFNSPWRAAVIAGDLDTLVNSDLIQNLNPATTSTDTSWVAPGRAAWSWWSDEQSASSVDKQKRTIDFAESMGFEYTTVDCCYVKTDLPEMADYATAHGVRLFAWVTAESINTPAKADAEMALLKSYGIVGLKVDFFLEDSQAVTGWYQTIAEAGERNEMMINFHGATKPGGENRTWPWVVTTEAVRGAEHYKYPPPTPARLDVTLPFVRNPLGGMDYTPVAISLDNPENTQAAALAQSIVFTSAMVHYADSAAAYEQWPGRHLLRAVPTVWDETHVVTGFPGRDVTLARRSGADWFVGAMTDESRTVAVPLDFLDTGTYTATLFADDRHGGIDVSTQPVTAATTLSFPLATHGGASVHISHTPLELIGTGDTRYEAEHPGNTLTGTASISTCHSCSEEAKIGNIDPSSSLTFEDVQAPVAGTYRLAVTYTSGDDTRALDVEVNGSLLTHVNVPTSGGWSVPGVLYVDAPLVAGDNTVRLSNPGLYSPDIDSLTMSRSYVASTVADVATISGVTVGSAGNHTVRIEYRSAAGAQALVRVNGGTARTITLHPTGSVSATGASTVGLDLAAGVNTIDIEPIGASVLEVRGASVTG